MGKAVGSLPPMAFDWRDRLFAELNRQNREMKEVSVAAGLGETYVRDALKRGRGGKIENLQKISLALGRSRDFLSREDVSDAPPPLLQLGRTAFEIAEAMKPNASEPRPVEPGSIHDTLPVYGSAMGGPDGRFEHNGEVIDRIAAPPGLRGTRNAYAVYVIGSSMENRYFEGEAVYVNPAKPVKPGDFVVLQLKPKVDGDPYEGVVKRLVSRGTRSVVVEQYNPKMLIEFAADEVRAIHKIVLGGEG